VLNLVVRNPEIAEYGTLTGSISRYAAALLVHARLPPLMVLPYVADDGFYRGFGRGMRRVLPTDIRKESVDSNSAKTVSWVSRTTGPTVFSDVPVEFKAQVGGPKLWMLPLVYAWLGFTDSMSADVTVTRTVIASKQPKSASSSSTLFGTPSGRFPKGHRYTQSLEFTTKKSGSFVTLPAVTRHSVMPPPLEPVAVVPKSVVDETERKVSATGDWVQSLPKDMSGLRIDTKSKRSRRHSGRSSTSSGSPVTVERRRVTAKDYKLHKLYPMFEDYFKRYMESESATKRDWVRYDNLCSMKVVFAHFGTARSREDDMTSYFLSVLRVHNCSVLAYMQSRVANSPTLVQRLLNNSQHDNYEDIVRRTSDLLTTFELENYFVGIDERTRHSRGDSSVAITPDHDGTAQRGAFYVSLGPQYIIDAIRMLETLSVPIISTKDEGVLACAWNVFGNILSVRHPFETGESELKLPPGATGVIRDSQLLDLVLFRAELRGLKYFPVSSPVAERDVVVLAHDVLTQEFQIHGPFKLGGSQEGWFIPYAFSQGYSGALVYDVMEGCVVGLYTGMYIETDFEKFGKVVPLDKFENLSKF